ncbi:MAG: DUF427 domain-containing protein [Xanthomonadales bacterium]|nr:DUF427 domain-containing protein [Xanthomonadales bacterium]
MKAIWNNTVIAESDDTVVVDGYHYFPLAALVMAHFRPASQTTVCSWKGTANYYDVVVNGETNPGAAWCYAEPRDAAAAVRGRVGFWRGIKVTG